MDYYLGLHIWFWWEIRYDYLGIQYFAKMKIFPLIIFFITVCLSVQAQRQDSVLKPLILNYQFDNVDLKLSDSATVYYVDFKVKRNGKIKKIKAKSVECATCSADAMYRMKFEAWRFIWLMDKFEPAIQNEKPMATKFTLPIKYYGQPNILDNCGLDSSSFLSNYEITYLENRLLFYNLYYDETNFDFKNKSIGFYACGYGLNEDSLLPKNLFFDILKKGDSGPRKIHILNEEQKLAKGNLDAIIYIRCK